VVESDVVIGPRDTAHDSAAASSQASQESGGVGVRLQGCTAHQTWRDNSKQHETPYSVVKQVVQCVVSLCDRKQQLHLTLVPAP